MICNLCPRKCGADRSTKYGFCRSGESPKLARAALHMWEEPCISVGKGSGTVFFSGCVMRCIFCQNAKISDDGFGREISTAHLAEIFCRLEESGAANINLVNPTHFVPAIIKALDLVKNRLKIPIVYNSGGYELTETLKLLNGYIDVYLPDFKYAEDSLAIKYSNAPGYTEYAKNAIKEMVGQTGKAKINNDGVIEKGVIVRHLVLPDNTENSVKVLRILEENFSPEEILVSIMGQYMPYHKSGRCPEINRRLTQEEYDSVLAELYKTGFDGYVQELDSAQEDYIPEFNLEGV